MVSSLALSSCSCSRRRRRHTRTCWRTRRRRRPSSSTPCTRRPRETSKSSRSSVSRSNMPVSCTLLLPVVQSNGPISSAVVLNSFYLLWSSEKSSITGLSCQPCRNSTLRCRSILIWVFVSFNHDFLFASTFCVLFPQNGKNNLPIVWMLQLRHNV